MGKALYRKHRSKSLDEIVGQSHVTDVLSRALKQGKIAHAYLFTGPRGTGKTSIARILAHEINQLPYTDESTHLDIIEIDAASNNGVDDVRDLREKVQIAPVSAAKKVYIIDEVHMLSKPAFNALLKTLEEPPEHVVFILATTDVDKLPATIISRTQRFGFRAASPENAKQNLKKIADKEKIKIDDASLDLLAQRSNGSFRDGVSLLDQLSSMADTKEGITQELVELTLGLAPNTLVSQLLKATVTHDTAAILKLLEQSENDGIQTAVLIDQLVASVRSQLGDAPQLVTLIDDLLTAGESSKPALKLLTALLSFAAPKQKPTTAALAVAAPTISAPIEQLSVAPKPAPVAPKAMVKQQATVKPSAQTVAKTPEEEVIARKPAAPENFNWETLLEYVRTHYVALYSVLSKCSYELDGDTLKLYTVRRFNKTKLDDMKYHSLIAKSLDETGAGDLTIETIPTPPPPSDSTAAAVAAIMGGGEQVNVEE
jgi:DNA polymerase III subunit gamma/tau